MSAQLRRVYLVFLCCAVFYHLLEASASEETKIKAIVFDFGGVIAKTDRHQIAGFISESLKISLEDAYYAMENLKKYSIHHDLEDEYWLNFVNAKGEKLPVNWLKQLNHVRFMALKEIPGMVNLVKNLKKQGFQTALLSNVRKSQAQIKRKLGYYELFHPTILSYEVGIKKPDPRIYYLILNKLNLIPQEVIFIDNKTANVATAKSIGMVGIEFSNIEHLVQELKEKGIMLSI